MNGNHEGREPERPPETVSVRWSVAPLRSPRPCTQRQLRIVAVAPSNSMHRSGVPRCPAAMHLAEKRRPVCLLGVCSDVSVPFDSARYQATAKWAESRAKRHRRALSGSRRTRNSGLLIRGFGVRVPGGAPVLTWGFCYPFTLVYGPFRAMVAPRLLVSPNIVDHGDRTPGEAPTDGYTQRDIWRKGAGRGIAADAAQGTTGVMRWRHDRGAWGP